MKYFSLFLLFLAVSCTAPEDAYVFYDEPTYAEKERQLPISTEQAATLFARNYFEQHPSAEKVTAYIDMLFRKKYIVSPTKLLHNTKFGACYLTPDTYWVDGKTGRLKKNRQEVLYLRRVGRADENGMSIFREGTFIKTYMRDSLLNTP